MTEINQKEMDLVSTFALCRDMDSDELNVLQKNLAVRSYSAGEMLFEQGSRDEDHLFIILEGHVNVLAALDQQGHSMIISTQLVGSVSGILSFIDGRPHNASAKAMCPVRVATLSRQNFEQLKESQPTVAAKLLQYLIVSADDMACLLMNKLSRSQSYINAVTPSMSQWH